MGAGLVYLPGGKGRCHHDPYSGGLVYLPRHQITLPISGLWLKPTKQTIYMFLIWEALNMNKALTINNFVNALAGF